MNGRLEPDHETKREPTSGESVKAVVVVLLVAALVVALLAWFVATFIIQGCLGPCAA